MSFIVAIDGPAGSGKGTLAKEISRLTDLINIYLVFIFDA